MTKQIVPPYIKEYLFAVVAIAERVYVIQDQVTPAIYPPPRPIPRPYPQVILVTTDPREAFQLAKKYSNIYKDFEFFVDLVDDPFGGLEPMPKPQPMDDLPLK